MSSTVRDGLAKAGVSASAVTAWRSHERAFAGVVRRAGASLMSVLAVLGSGAVGTACAENEQSIFIRQVSAAAEGGSCTITADPSNLFLGSGTLDVAFKVSYDATLLVGNQLTARSSRQQVRTESSRVVLEGSEVFAVDNATGAVVFGPNTVPGSGFIDPASGTDPSYGLLGSVLYLGSPNDGLVAELRSKPGAVASITSHVRAFGHTLGGTNVESGEYLFQIQLCHGCLVTFPAEATDRSKPAPNCDAAAATGTTVGGPCILGQDDTVDCRVCKQHLGSASVCNPS